MRRALAATAAVLLLGVMAAGCGGGDDDPPPTTVTTEPTTTPSTIESNANAVACLTLSTDGLQLLNDFRQASRGIIAPDPAPYKERADALRAEYARLGCPGELLRGFPAGT